MITENLQTLKIIKLTQEQYDRESAAGNLDVNALYLTPDEEIDLSSFGITATANELNKLDGVTATTDELNYVSGVTSNIQAQLDNKKDKDNIPTEGLTFEMDIDGSCYACTGIGSSTDEHIVIPAYYKGLPVISITEAAFSGEYILQSVSLPDTITEVGFGAFEGCINLRNVKFPNSQNCYAGIDDVVIEAAAFEGCSKLRSVDLSNTNVQTIEDNAFAGCTALKSVTIPNTTIHIGDYAFANCSSLESIVIPKSVTAIGSLAFEGCTALTIYCEGDEPVYTNDTGTWMDDWNSDLRPVVWNAKIDIPSINDRLNDKKDKDNLLVYTDVGKLLPTIGITTDATTKSICKGIYNTHIAHGNLLIGSGGLKIIAFDGCEDYGYIEDFPYDILPKFELTILVYYGITSDGDFDCNFYLTAKNADAEYHAEYIYHEDYDTWTEVGWYNTGYAKTSDLSAYPTRNEIQGTNGVTPITAAKANYAEYAGMADTDDEGNLISSTYAKITTLQTTQNTILAGLNKIEAAIDALI